MVLPGLLAAALVFSTLASAKGKGKVTSTAIVATNVPAPTPTPTPTPTPDDVNPKQPDQNLPPPRVYTARSNTCPPSSLQTPATPIGDIDVDIYWQPCCSGDRKHIIIGSASLTTTGISPLTTATAASLNINALPEDCLLNFYDTSIRWGDSPATTYNPGQGKPGMCVLYPWFEDTNTLLYSPTLINVTCGADAVNAEKGLIGAVVEGLVEAGVAGTGSRR